MAATVVDTSVKTATWVAKKPSDYKGKDLDNALKSYEALAGKKVSIPADLPTLPNQSATDFKQCVKDMQSAITDLQKAVTHLESLGASLKSVSGAANKTSTELQKLAKDKSGDDKNKYLEAASVASGISAQASAAAKKIG